VRSFTSGLWPIGNGGETRHLRARPYGLEPLVCAQANGSIPGTIVLVLAGLAVIVAAFRMGRKRSDWGTLPGGQPGGDGQARPSPPSWPWAPMPLSHLPQNQQLGYLFRQFPN